MSNEWKGAATVAAAALLAGLCGCERKPAGPQPAGQAQGAPAAPAPRPPAAAGPPVPLVLAPLAPVSRPAFGPTARLAVLPDAGELAEAVFSADGRHVAFVITRDGNAWVWAGGQPGRPWETIRGLVVREGTGQVAYVGRRGSKEVAVVDGQEGPRYAEIGALRFAADGRVIYSARKGEAWVVVSGGSERPVVTGGDPEPRLGLGGQRIVFLEQASATAGAGLRACPLDLGECVAGPPHDGVALLRSEPTGRRWSYVVGQAGREAVAVVDLEQAALPEQLTAWYDHVPLTALSDDGGQLAFLARGREEQLMVRGATEQAIPSTATPMLMKVSRSGRVVALAVEGGRAVLLVDGKSSGSALEGIAEPVFSPDGARLAYVVGAGGRSMVVSEGGRGPVHEKVVTPAFQPVGTGLVYRARRQGERYVVQANEQMQTIREHPHYREVHAVAFAPDGKSVGYGVRDGNELWWRVEKLEGVGAR